MDPRTLVQAMRHIAPQSRTALYWAARLTLVNRAEDLAAFDAVFDAIFADAVLGLDPARRTAALRPPAAPAPGVRGTRRRRQRRRRPAVDDAAGLDRAPPSPPTSGIVVPDSLPSRLVARADEPFDRFDEDDLRRIGTWLEQLSDALAAPAQPCAGRCTAAASGSMCGSRCGRRGRRAGRRCGWRGPAGAVGRVGWCWCATSADRCGRMRRSTCTSCGRRRCARRAFGPRCSHSRRR